MNWNSIKSELSSYIEQALEEYGLVIALLVIGMLIGYFGKSLIVDRKYGKQIIIRFKEKDLQIAQLNHIISERLNKISVEEKDKSFFKRLKTLFKKTTKKAPR